MTDISTDALREALQLLIRSDMAADPKGLLIRVVMDSLAAKAAAALTSANGQKELPWQQAEIDIVAACLQGKQATSWQNADEMLTRLARELHRDAREVGVRAVEWGFGAAVDYRLAKALSV
jgi:hypothetical protein